MEERSSRLTEACRQLADGVKYIPYCQTKLVESRKWAQGNHVSYTFYNESIAN
jgi:exonuclease VII small subunit